MSCSSHIPENHQRVVCKKVYHKRYYAENKERILARQKRYRTENVEILKPRRKRWYEINKERLVKNRRAYYQQNKKHIRNYRRQYRKNNRERINEYWKSYYAKNKEQINQRLRNQRQRNIGARDQESKKQETSPNTLWNTDGQDLNCNQFSLWSYSINVIKTQTLCFVYINLMTLLLQVSTFVPMPKGATFRDWTIMHAVVGMKTTTG